MDRVFLDANVLFSAAYATDNRFLQLWALEEIQLVSSTYAIEEARRNLTDVRQQERLERLVETMEIVSGSTVFSPLPAGFNLPEKDIPILAAALLAQATHLLTGDKQHFGPYFGQTILGVLIQRPTEYLREKVE